MGTLLLIGLPVAFALALLAIAGMYFFNGGTFAFMQIPIISYKSLDAFYINCTTHVCFNEPGTFS